MRIAEGRCLVFFHSPLKIQLQKKIGVDTTNSILFQDVLLLHRKKVNCKYFLPREEWTKKKRKIPEKDRGAECGSNLPLTLQHSFFLHRIYYPCTILALPPAILSSNSDPGSHGGPSSPLHFGTCLHFYREKK